MLFQGVRFEAMWCCVKVVASYATDEALCLEVERTIHIKHLPEGELTDD